MYVLNNLSEIPSEFRMVSILCAVIVSIGHVLENRHERVTISVLEWVN